MRFFLDKPCLTTADELGLRATHDYLEVEWPINKNLCAVIYIIPNTKSSLSIVSCWETTFDRVMGKSSKSSIKPDIITWPTMAKISSTTLDNHYDKTQFVRLKDIDNGKTKWFMSYTIEDIDANSLDNLFVAQIIQAIAIVIGKSIETFIELQECKHSRVASPSNTLSLSTLALTAIAGVFGVDLDALA